MPILPRRFKKLQNVLNKRMDDLTVVLEDVEKPHNLSAILRSCDAVGVLQAHIVCTKGQSLTFNSTAQGSQKWVKLNHHKNIEEAIKKLKNIGYKVYGTSLNIKASNYLDYNYEKPTAFVLGAEKWGLSKEAIKLMDKTIYVPMQGMVQSLNVSVATAILLFEAVRQRKLAGILPKSGEGVSKETYEKTIFEWAYPEVAQWCKDAGREYPRINSIGEIVEELPRTIKVRY